MNSSIVVTAPSFVITTRPLVVEGRYEPVVARIFGGGTSAVVSAFTSNPVLREGAVLVSAYDRGTTTGAAELHPLG